MLEGGTMQKLSPCLIAILCGFAFSFSATCAGAVEPQQAKSLQAIPGDKDDDLRLFYFNGKVAEGSVALAKMNADANLTMWLAGNQFFAMEDVIHRFQKSNPGVGNVAVITMPPGMIVNAILAGGWRYQGKDYPMQPDLYASVDLGHLQALREKGMTQYMTYVRNKLELVVAPGNPKNIKGLDDLARPDLKVMLPNPITEGIAKFYMKKALIRHGIWDKLTGGGKECEACQVTPTTYFTAVHHREIPEALKAGTIDAGIVWSSEVGYAKQIGISVQGVPLPPEDSFVREVVYLIGPIKGNAHPKAASQYLRFLASAAGQDVYARYGFIKASKEDLRIRPIPAESK
jgi:sulfate/thiosulfate transport system substrate-binding protein